VSGRKDEKYQREMTEKIGYGLLADDKKPEFMSEEEIRRTLDILA
jgi:hypothetical protein